MIAGIFVTASVLAIVWLGLALLHGYQDGMDLSWRPLAYLIGGMLAFGVLLSIVGPEAVR